MSNLIRAVRNTLLAVAIASVPLAGIAQSSASAATAETGVEGVRKVIVDTAKAIGISKDKISYLGLDSKPISETTFYQAFSANPQQTWKLDGNFKVVDQKFGSQDLVVKLTTKE
jgi:hypothetical protein